jgi:hypothetical protein
MLLQLHPFNHPLQESLAKLQAENERLRRDNERFVRLIDSGEWGRGRVAELVSAGEVMRGERDALLKLIGSLRREFEAVAAAKGCQEDELRLLKEKMTVGVSCGCQLSDSMCLGCWLLLWFVVAAMVPQLYCACMLALGSLRYLLLHECIYICAAHHSTSCILCFSA